LAWVYLVWLHIHFVRELAWRLSCGAMIGVYWSRWSGKTCLAMLVVTPRQPYSSPLVLPSCAHCVFWVFFFVFFFVLNYFAYWCQLTLILGQYFCRMRLHTARQESRW
jgi:hypothetical protein